MRSGKHSAVHKCYFVNGYLNMLHGTSDIMITAYATLECIQLVQTLIQWVTFRTSCSIKPEKFTRNRGGYKFLKNRSAKFRLQFCAFVKSVNCSARGQRSPAVSPPPPHTHTNRIRIPEQRKSSLCLHWLHRSALDAYRTRMKTASCDYAYLRH